MISVIYAECHIYYAKCHYAECCGIQSLIALAEFFANVNVSSIIETDRDIF
jgi:hypothetical protein